MHFSIISRLAAEKRDDLTRRVEAQNYREDKDLKRMQRLIKALEDEDNGWKHWIKLEGEKEVPCFKRKVVDWLAAPIQWGEDMPDIATARGSAKHFFENEDLAVLDKLGVWVVEGDFPGSGYRAAELRKRFGQANEIAEDLGLPYRFRKEEK